MTIGIQCPDNKEQLGAELLEYIKKDNGSINCDKILDIDFDDEQQANAEWPKRAETVCRPLIFKVCKWLAANVNT